MRGVKDSAIPADLAEHLMRHWPRRKRIDEAVVIHVGEVRDAPPWLIAQIEGELRLRLANNLMRERWVMISMTGPEWSLRPDGLAPPAPDKPAPDKRTASERPWEPTNTAALTDLDRHAVVICRIDGWAVPTFLEPPQWWQGQDEDTDVA